MRDERYYGPTDIRVDPAAKGFTDEKQVVRDESPPDKNGNPTGFQFISFADPLAFYERKGHITAKERRAGETYYRLWYYGSGRSPYVLMRYGEVHGSSDADAIMLLGTEYYRATQAISGQLQQKIAYSVCCEGRTAGRGRILPLREALQDLMKHFKKLAAERRGKSNSVENTRE